MPVFMGVHGVGPTLEVLRKLEPALYKSIASEMKSTATPVVAAVKGAFPLEPWSTTSRRGNQWSKYGRTKKGRKPSDEVGASFPKYDISGIRQGVSAQVGGRKIRRGPNAGAYPILRIRQTNAAGQIYDLAKLNRTTGRESFVKNLNSEGSPSRIMWPTVTRALPLIMTKLNMTIGKVEREFTAEIASETALRQTRSTNSARQARNALGQFGRFL